MAVYSGIQEKGFNSFWVSEQIFRLSQTFGQSLRTPLLVSSGHKHPYNKNGRKSAVGTFRVGKFLIANVKIGHGNFCHGINYQVNWPWKNGHRKFDYSKFNRVKVSDLHKSLST